MKCIIHITSNVVLTDVSQTILHALEVELMYFKSIKIKASRNNFFFGGGNTNSKGC